MSEIEGLKQRIADLERQVAVLTAKINNVLANERKDPAFGKWVIDHQQQYQDFQRRFPPVTLDGRSVSRSSGGPT